MDRVSQNKDAEMDVEIDLETLVGRPRKAEQKIDPEVAVARLTEWSERYAEALTGPRFEVGDLVTPSKDCKYGGAGLPHRVVQTRLVGTMNYQPSVCSCSSDDMRIIGVNSTGDVVSIWCESALFEKWVTPDGQ
jgi:hypothetical protein